MSLPVGTDSKKLPIGLQIIARPFDEAMIFRIAHFLEKKFANSV